MIAGTVYLAFCDGPKHCETSREASKDLADCLGARFISTGGQKRVITLSSMKPRSSTLPFVFEIRAR